MQCMQSGNHAMHAVLNSCEDDLLANPLEGAAVDLLQVCYICQHLVAQGTPDASTTGKRSCILSPV